MTILIRLICVLMFGLCGGAAQAAEPAAAQQAVALVKSGIAYLQANGEEQALKAFNDPQGAFHRGELYITVYDMNGTSLANGANTRLVGKNMLELRDADGVYILRERIRTVQEKGSGWNDFMWPNPVTKKMERKSMYSEKFGRLIVSCGIYK
ncbi:MAG: cache domain-containing protein [Pseudomonadota bacterium]